MKTLKAILGVLLAIAVAAVAFLLGRGRGPSTTLPEARQAVQKETAASVTKLEAETAQKRVDVEARHEAAKAELQAEEQARVVEMQRDPARQPAWLVSVGSRLRRKRRERSDPSVR